MPTNVVRPAIAAAGLSLPALADAAGSTQDRHSCIAANTAVDGNTFSNADARARCKKANDLGFEQ